MSLLFLPSYAMTQKVQDRAPSGLSNKVRTREIQKALLEATRLLRENPRKAIDLLKRLNERFPDQPNVLVHLGHAYQAVDSVDSAMVMYRRCLVINHTSLEAAKSLGMLYFSQGENERGEGHFRRFLETSGHSLAAYKMVGTSMAELGYYDLALNVFREGRTRSDAHYRLTLHIADQEKAMGNYRAALTEYLNYVDRFPPSYATAKQRIIQLFISAEGAERSSDEWRALLEVAERRAIRSMKARREIKDILSSVYLNGGLLEKALEAALEADQPGQSDGRTLYLLADGLRNGYIEQSSREKRRYFDLCIRALEAYIERHPKTVQTQRAAYNRASLLADAAKGLVPGFEGERRQAVIQNAIDELDRVFRKYPGSEEASLAAVEKGDLLFEVQRKPREALAAYNEGLKRARATRGVFVEKIGRMYLILEEYDLARRHFAKFIRSSNEERREAGIYYTGVLLGFTGEYEMARDTLTSLAETNPASIYANDAIELAWLIEEGRQGDEKLLGRFIDALKAELANDTSAVAEHLERVIARGPAAKLHARALYKLGGVYAQMGDFERALDSFQSFLDLYPRHDLRPDVHRAVARVYEHGLGNVDLALKEYEHILAKFPKYLLLDEVRADINRLKPEENDGK
ncbi:MAG: tetratricopeptide repeat protein [Candidatus Latescibacteria bacterium]|nr:tetratricopeptide repeat protein [Candidatus Latescibacterota bacterium]NIM22605.1 tetratricopeptide repeat protein [Candidatus Latescibacterota bacterium]NIM64894.1 tetratricopeptide repeat protein [Candidatus Latescibacterota bacterium]NIO01409.1 tetratricopeptide repeat protein [Candidatus Latescibacterota bacterium]NIO78809.1 tetratricopeptide repeat protein [Candidatus Latescibacterota bacterium]